MLSLTSLLAGCGDAGNGPATGDIGTLDGPDVTLIAATEEVFTVGSVAGDSWDTFGRVTSVHFDAQANLHIYDLQAEHILVVGPDGSLIQTVGGPGEGPGEFGGVNTAIVERDGSYTVLGFMHIDLLEPGGAFVRRIHQSPVTGMVRGDMTLPDGRLVVTSASGLDEEEEEFGRPIHLLPLDSSALLDGSGPQLHYTAWELPEETEDESGMSGDLETGMTFHIAAGRAFEPNLALDVLTDGRIALTDSIGYRVKLIGLDGSVVGTIERAILPIPVDDAIMEAERERYRERTSSLAAMQFSVPLQLEQEGVEGLTFADEVPVLYGLKADWEDRLWILRRGPTGDDAGPTDIVTPDGDYIGTLPPDGLRAPDAFGPDGLMAYIELDDLEVATVRVVRLLALEPQG